MTFNKVVLSLILIHLFTNLNAQEKEEKDSRRLAAEFELERTKNPRTGKIPKGSLFNAMLRTAKEKGKSLLQSRTTGNALLNWQERGPNSDRVGPYNGNTRANNGVTSGVIEAVMVDLGDPTHKTVWVGGETGGLWKTTDITQPIASWVLANDFISNLNVSGICQDPTDPNIMYFCTGDVYGGGPRGAGVFKSTDHGVSWIQLPSSITTQLNGYTTTRFFTECSKILCDYQGNIYLATRYGGVVRSSKASGGNSWENITPYNSPNLDIGDMEISSISGPGRLHITTGIASTSKYFYTDVPSSVSPTTGWTSPVIPFTSYNARTEIACSGNVLYALPCDDYGYVPFFYKSNDGGSHWFQINPLPNSINLANSQGWWDLSIGINPSNPNECIIGGLDTWKTIDGGNSWTQISNWVNYPVSGQYLQYVHADQHNILWWDNGTKLLFACDGGLHYSSDGGATIRDRNIGLRLKQFYSVSIHPTDVNYFLAGAQDNGTHQLTLPGLGSSVEVQGGDGGYTAIDKDEPQYQIGAYIGNIYRISGDGGNSWTTRDFGYHGPFIDPFDFDNSSNILYGSYSAGQYFRWNNPHGGSPSTDIISIPSFNNGYVASTTVSPNLPNRVYFGINNGKIVRVDNANSTPTDVDISATGMAGYVSCVAIGTDDQNLLATYSSYGVKHVWASTNGGNSWAVIDGNLPDMPVRGSLFFPGDNSKALIATETGIWQTDLINGPNTVWFPNSTFPTVRTDMLKIRISDGVIAAATYGRGIWTTKLACPTITVINPSSFHGYPYVSFSESFTESGGSGQIIYTTNSRLPNGFSFTRSGILIGTTSQIGSFPIVVTATDANGCVGTGATYNLVISNCTIITVTNPLGSTGIKGVPFSQTFTANGGVAPVAFFSSSIIPNGLTLTSTGVLSGTPTQTGNYDIVVNATDANGCVGTGGTYSLVIIDCPTITVTNPTTTTGSRGIYFSQTFTSTGGTTPIVFNTSSTLPSGLTLSSNGILNGTPSQLGNFSILVKATDANGCYGTGTTYNLTISCPLVTVNPVDNQVVCNGAKTTAVTFSGSPSGTIFKWRMNKGIGASTSGIGTIPSFTAINEGSTPRIATITVTPFIGSCSGTATTFTITVNPPDVIATPSTQSVCSGSTIIPITFTGTSTGATFSWTRDNIINVTGIPESGSGAISGTLVNNSNEPVKVSFTITPTPNNCPGVIRIATIIVNPSAEFIQPTNQTLCNNEITTPVNFSTLVAGMNYNWTNSETSIGLAASGKGNIASFKAINSGNTPVEATINVTGNTAGVFAYIANFASNSISLVNTLTNTVLTTIKVPSPYGVAVSPDGSRVYVTNSKVAVINTASNTVIANIPVGSAFGGIAISHNGERVYVTNYSTNDVSVISTATNSVIATIPVGNSPEGITVSPDDTKVYVTNGGSDDISVINSSTNTVESNVNVDLDSYPFGICINPSGSKVYVTNVNSDNVSVINTSTNNVETNIVVGYNPSGLTISPDGNHLYVAVKGLDNVSVINTTNHTIEAAIPVGSLPYGISVTPDGSQVFCTNRNSKSVSVINTISNTVASVIPVGSVPYSFGNFITTSTVCTGATKFFKITVNPTPKAEASVPSQSVCSATSILPITFSGNVIGTIYNWYRDNVAGVSGISGSGSGDISGTLYNVTNAPITITFTVTPTANGCSGSPITVTVTVNPDHESPSITAPPAINTVTNDGCTATGILLGSPVTSDNCGVADVTNDAPVIFPVGTTTVTWTVKDKSGNTSRATQLVIVTDNIKPTITKPSNITVSNSLGSCTATVNLQTPATSDNCSVASVTNDQPSNLYPVGITTVIWTVIDAYGNSNSTLQTVTVVDAEKPNITCPIIPVQCFNTTGVYNIPSLIATDNCGIATISFSITGATIRDGTGLNASGSFNPGQNVINWTVSDLAGNTMSCATTVNIDYRITTSIPDVYVVNPGGNANTIYKGYGPTSLSLNAIVSGGTKPYTYNWTVGSSAGSSSNTTATYTVSPASSTTYYLNVKDVYGCTVANISKSIYVVNVLCGNKLDKVTVCNYDNGIYTTICISPNGVPAHLSAGSYLGTCNPGVITSTTTATAPSHVSLLKAVKVRNEFNTKVSPNPSSVSFKISVESSSAEIVTIRVKDVLGRTIQIASCKPGEPITLGNTYIGGTYFADISQGQNYKVIKFIKIN